MSSTPLALFVGMPGLSLSADEIAFFREANPYGLFLFRRNLEEPDQIRAMVDQFRDAVGRADAPVYIDQEGGRVQRLNNGNWPLFRALGDFGALAMKDIEAAKRALKLSTQAMGSMLSELKLGSGTTPVIDLQLKGMHEVIGGRAFSDDPEMVTMLGRIVVETMLEVGAMPIIKHIPGYGRVTVDPHLELPTISTPLETLFASDFKPFLALKHAPWAMVAHVIYSEIDPTTVASVSAPVCDFIRKRMNYDGVLISDCVTMEALSGSWASRVAGVLDAGYDIALHSQGTLADSEAAAKAARPLSVDTLVRLRRADAMLGEKRVDVVKAHAEAEAIFNTFNMARKA
ncbi:glycoside hydrolase family 3 protein [Martelella alba]|uniref:beta-N-acetylhexosaminidase n=1 Tax=Martelella alba TaxID=2590451 RepID=A0A506U946_9HYPH|nr:glycoside hydrolase family 3 N-terminal domain-containing protein [Martelella alba]TPW30048.1 glycoside hydrolase family 3 protein [Martelella alba]